MKDRIVAYFKGLLRSWKFWMAVLMGIFMAWAFADGVTGFGKILGSILGGFVVGYICWYVCWWTLKMMWKIFAGIFKITGKAAVGAGKMAVKGAASMVTGNPVGSSSGSPKAESKPQKNVRKVWTMKYVGPHDNRAPGVINVPSVNAYGRPTTSEVIDALLDMGYSDADAHALGGVPDSWWKEV